MGEMKHRLLFITNILPPYRIPLYNRLSQLVESEGFKMDFIFLSKTESRRKWNVKDSNIMFDYTILPSINLGAARGRPTADNILNYNILKNLIGANLIVVGGYDYMTYWVVLFWARILRIPLFLFCESTLYEERMPSSLIRKLKSLFLSSCKGFIVPGRASREYLRSFGENDSRIFTAPNSVDHHFFLKKANELNPKRDELRNRFGVRGTVFLFVGRMAPEKHVTDLIEAFKRIRGRGRDAYLVLVGSGPEQPAYEKYCKNNGLQKDVCFAGFRQLEEIPFYYAIADVLVLPSCSEPWGLVLNEAMASGLPVITSDRVGAAYDLVVEGRTGFFYPAGAITVLSEHMDIMCSGKISPEVWRQEVQKHVSGFTPERQAEGFISAFRNTLLNS